MAIFLTSQPWVVHSQPPVASYSDKLVIITHIDVPDDKLSKEQIIDLYSLKNTTWSDGSLVYLFDMKGKTDENLFFYQYLNISSREMRQRWMKAVLSGEIIPPRVTKSASEMVKLVGQKEGAIGYTLASEVTDEVKIIASID